MSRSFRLAAGAFLAVCLGLLSAALPWGGARAQAPMPGMPAMPGVYSPGPNQVLLTAQDIENFIACYPELTALGDRYGSPVDPGGLASNPAEAFAALQASQAALAQMNALLNAHGFTDMGHWLSIAYSITLAHGWDEGGDDPLKGIDDAIAEINADATIGPQQRSFAIAALESQRAALARFQPPPENVALVNQYENELDGVLGQ